MNTHTLVIPQYPRSRFMQLNPARGRKPSCVKLSMPPRKLKVYAAQPREGTETLYVAESLSDTYFLWFMQLNPARGRKLTVLLLLMNSMIAWFMQLNPARGRKPYPAREYATVYALLHGLCSSTPRGDGNSPPYRIERINLCTWFMQLNPARGRKRDTTSHNRLSHTIQVYAAQPREGTETYNYTRRPEQGRLRFMQLNPARGRKPILVMRST